MYSHRIVCGGCNQPTDLALSHVNKVSKLRDIPEAAPKQARARQIAIGRPKNQDFTTNVYGVGACNLCGYPNLFIFRTTDRYYTAMRDHIGKPEVLVGGETFVEIVDTIPEPRKVEIDPRWPDKVASRFRDAEMSFLTDGLSNEIVAAQARNCLQSALRHRGIKEKNLKAEIAVAANNGQITPELHDWAQSIRIYGNEASHDGDITGEEAEEAIDFLKLFLRVFLSLPEDIHEKKQQNAA